MKHFSKKTWSAGVTFIELIVVISIFAIISTVVLFNFGDFSTTLSLQNVSHDIALRIVQAQREAISGKYTSLLNGATSADAPVYGVYFGTDTSTTANFNAATPGKEFIYFADIDRPGYTDEWYDQDQTSGQLDTHCVTVTTPSAPTECLDRTFITTGDTITQICVDGDCTESEVAILFRRPFPDAIIHVPTDYYIDPVHPSTSHATAEITITSAKGAQKKVTVNKLGQVSVQ